MHIQWIEDNGDAINIKDKQQLDFVYFLLVS